MSPINSYKTYNFTYKIIIDRKVVKEKEYMKEEYARDLVRVSKLTKEREKELIDSIKNGIESEF